MSKKKKGPSLPILKRVFPKTIPIAEFVTTEKKMSKKITLTVQELEHEIKQAFVHGQGNSIMMEAGLERNEREDYTSSVMRRLTNQEDE